METDFIKIRKDRVGALIGKEGRTKCFIEKKAKVKLKISEDGGVELRSEDGLALWRAKEVVKAVGRGFNPTVAMRLTSIDYSLLIIDLDKLFNGKDNEVRRIKARVIGEDGRAREALEQLSNSKIVVLGKTITVIATEEEMPIIEKALNMMINGASHASAYQMLEGERRNMRKGL